MAAKSNKSPQDASKPQGARNPMLAVRVPRALYRALRKAARDEHRQFPDWFRLNVHKMLPAQHEYGVMATDGLGNTFGVAREAEAK